MESLSYTYSIDALKTGASFGNFFTFARLDAQTNLMGLWSSLDDQFYVGEWHMDFFVNHKSLLPVQTIFRPESQTSIFRDGNFVVEKKFFLPYCYSLVGKEKSFDLNAAIFLVRLQNASMENAEFVFRHRIIFPAVVCDLFTKQPPIDQTREKVRIERGRNFFTIVTIGSEDEARIVGSTSDLVPLTIDDTTLLAESRHQVPPGQFLEVSVVLTYSPDGVAAAYQAFTRCLDARGVLEVTLHEFDRLLNRALIVTPEPIINRGMQWAKVNTLRVQQDYRLGHAFTNDPPQDIIVVRDVAWYVFGADYLTPEFAHNVLSLCEQNAIHEGGKLTEFIHGNEDPPRQHDYNLNINDDTPLFVLALFHHAAVCKDVQFLQHVYPSMKKACDWILSLIDHGLVWCTATGTNVWGICSWRNIIDDYSLSGAVTEINSECYAALLVTAEAARRIGKFEDAARYQRSAEDLKQAINTTLVSEKTGFYLLNIGNDGVRHRDVTGDLVFPVMFGVADEPMRHRILERLTKEDLWTPYGARTVSADEKNYDPDFGYQLMGGIWPNLSAWIAYSLRNESPNALVEAMKNLYAFCEPNHPRQYGNVVPGQFPERLHGESYQSKGMSLSPWMPPTYLWLAVEGLLGLKASLTSLELNPSIPAHWKWIAATNLPYRGEWISAFLFEGTLYTTHVVKSSFPLKVGKSVSVSSGAQSVFAMGIENEEATHIFAVSNDDVEADLVIKSNGRESRVHVRLMKGEPSLLRLPQPAMKQETRVTS